MGCVLLLLLVSSVILFLQFLSEMSTGNLDILRGPVSVDQLAELAVVNPCHRAVDSPSLDNLTTILDLVTDCDGEIRTDVADIGEVEGLRFLIFHAVSVSWADKKIEKKMRLGETFF